MSDRALTWVHVSDLHFGHGDAQTRFDQRSVTRSLIRDARVMRTQVGTPDFLLATGDIAFSANAEHQYSQARAFLSELCRELGIASQKVLLVPGNHDVDRKLANTFVGQTLHKQLRESPRQLDELLSDPAQLQPLWSKLSAYCTFAADYGVPSISPSEPHWVCELPGPWGKKKILAVGLNTCLLSCDGNDSPQNLALGYGQILRAIEQQPEDALLLVLMHHPPEWLADGKRLLNMLQTRPHILFSGHVHAQRSDLGAALFSGVLMRCSAGASHADGSGAAEHAYAWGRLDATGLALYPRLWVKEADDFAAQPTPGNNPFRRGDSVWLPLEDLSPTLKKWIRAQESLGALNNPFHKVGTMPANQPSYVRRDCDEALEVAFASESLIVLNGDSQIGKSSLSIRAQEYAKKQGRIVCHVDLQDLNLFDAGELEDDFLSRIRRSLGNDRLMNWGALKEYSQKGQPITLFIDEFGRLKNQKEQQCIVDFIARLHHCVTSSPRARNKPPQLQAVLCLIPSIRTLLDGIEPEDRKYKNGWHSIQIPLFTNNEIIELLRLLPEPTSQSVRAHVTMLAKMSDGRPQRLQCLCYELYQRTAEGTLSEDKLSELVLDRKSYQ